MGPAGPEMTSGARTGRDVEPVGGSSRRRGAQGRLAWASNPHTNPHGGSPPTGAQQKCCNLQVRENYLSTTGNT